MRLLYPQKQAIDDDDDDFYDLVTRENKNGSRKAIHDLTKYHALLLNKTHESQ